MQAIIAILNQAGPKVMDLAWSMLWQSNLLIVAVFIVEWVLRCRVRAAVRYALWWVVLVKLVLPPSLALPTGLGWWLRPSTPIQAQAQTRAMVVTYGPSVASGPSVLAPEPSGAPPREPLSAAATGLVVAGSVSLGLLAWMLARWRQAAQAVRRATEPPVWLQRLLDEDRRALGLSRPIRLRLLEETVSPAVCGLFRPVVLLPKVLVGQLSGPQLRAVLLHELVHLRRGDVWANCVQALIQVVYWWHPLLWLANARVRRVREEAVDDAVVTILREDAETYAPTLLEVAKLALQRPLATLGLVGILESRSFLRQRIERLLEGRPAEKAGLTFAATLCVVTFGAVAVPMGQEQVKTSEMVAASASNAAPLFSRILKVAPGTFLEDLKRRGELPESDKTNTTAQLLRSFCQRAGVTITPPKTIFLNENAGILFVRASASELDLIEKKVQRLNTGKEAASAQAQTNVPVRIASARTNLVPAMEEPVRLYTRMMKVDPNTFAAGLRGVSGLTNSEDRKDIMSDLRDFFNSVGVDLAPPKTVFYKDREGTLLVRGTLQDLDSIEMAVQALNIAPPQINIKATFLDLPVEATAEIWRSLEITNTTGTTDVIILTEAQARKARELARAKAGEDLLGLASVTTLSGRQAQVQIASLQTIVTNINPAALTPPGISGKADSTNGLYLSTNLPMGPTLDLVPFLAADDYTVRLECVATVTEFLGYDQPTNSPTVYIDGKRQTATPPLPRFRTRAITNSLALWDGQTALLGGPTAVSVERYKDKVPVLGDLPLVGSLFRGESSASKKKQLIVLITPTVIDPAGNRVHTEAEVEGKQRP